MLSAKKIIRLFIEILLMLLCVYLYLVGTKGWVEINLGTNHHYMLWLEIPILVALFFLIRPYRLADNSAAPFAIVGVVLLYFGIDVFYSYLSRLPTLEDYLELVNLYRTWPLGAIGFFLVSTAIIIYLLYGFLMNKSRKQTLAKFAVLSAYVVLLLTPTFGQVYSSVSYESVRLSEEIEGNGRLTSFSYLISKRYITRQQLAEYASRKSVFDLAKPNPLEKVPNIHIVVMESFFDTRLIDIEKETVDEINRLVESPDYSFISLPTYGGDTPKTEFELLTGLPSLTLLDRTDFNSLGGQPVDAFINRLVRDLGYRTDSLKSSQSTYFNSSLAYKSLGFPTMDYLPERKVDP